MNLKDTITVFFKHQLTVKMFHFQTKYYGAHKAADKYLQKFTANLDRFMEVAQGKHGTIEAKELEVKFKTVDEKGMKEHLDSFVDKLKNSNVKWGEIPELSVIRDEMLADAYQFKYLLGFK